MSLFPDPRRVVTGHDENGNAILAKDSLFPMQPTPLNADFAVLWETHQFPASNDGFQDPTEQRTMSLANEKGVILRVVDFKPKYNTIFHRTLSLDFGIIMEGEMTCHLDNGVELELKKGDVCVQRGTIHGWENKSDKPARVYFVLTAAEPVNIDGKVLRATGFRNDDVESGGK